MFAGPEFALILLHVLAWGGVCLRLSGRRAFDPWTKLTVLVGCGLALLAGEMFLLGEVHLLYKSVWFLSSAVALAVLYWIVSSRPVGSMIPMAGSPSPAEPGPADTFPLSRLRWLLLPIAVAALVVFVGCFRPAHSSDEWEYHWPAPMLWAHAHHWTASPYRLTSATALAEMLYTIAALFNNPTVAHFTSALFLVVVGGSVGSLARTVGASPWAAVAAAVSIPALLDYAPSAHNDLLVAAFAVAAYAVLFSDPQRTPSTATVGLCALLLGAAVSVKPFAVLTAPGVVLYLGLPWLRGGTLLDRAARSRSLRQAGAVSIAVVCTVAVWSIHCRVHSGHWWETRGMHFATDPTDPLWNSATVAGRHPRAIDWVAMPIGMPLLTAAGPETGQYGSRIGPLLLVFGLMAIPGVRRLSPTGRVKLFWLLGSALFFLFAFSPISPKTRFHLFVWLAGSVAAAVGLDWTQNLRTRAAKVFFFLFVILALFGPIDASRTIFSFVSRLSWYQIR